MKKELRNVLLTFALIGVVSFGVSQFYTRQATQLALTESAVEHLMLETEVELDRIYTKRLVAEQEELFRIKAETSAEAAVEQAAQKEAEAKALAAAKNATEAQAIQVANRAAEAARLAVAEQTAIEAKRQADLVAAQKATDKIAADLAAKQAAEKKAAELAAKKATRKSRAS